MYAKFRDIEIICNPFKSIKLKFFVIKNNALINVLNHGVTRSLSRSYTALFKLRDLLRVLLRVTPCDSVV